MLTKSDVSNKVAFQSKHFNYRNLKQHKMDTYINIAHFISQRIERFYFDVT